MPTDEKVLYLTFDDGPIPIVTPWVLEQLATYNAKATFFCVGGRASCTRFGSARIVSTAFATIKFLAVTSPCGGTSIREGTAGLSFAFGFVGGSAVKT